MNPETYLNLLRKLMAPWNLGDAPKIGYTQYCTLILNQEMR